MARPNPPLDSTKNSSPFPHHPVLLPFRTWFNIVLQPRTPPPFPPCCLELVNPRLNLPECTDLPFFFFVSPAFFSGENLFFFESIYAKFFSPPFVPYKGAIWKYRLSPFRKTSSVPVSLRLKSFPGLVTPSSPPPFP